MNLSVLIRKSKSFVRIKWRDKILFFQAFFLSGIARMAILYIPFKRVKKYMGKPMSESPFEVDNEVYKVAKRVAWAVNQACQYTPWKSKCLVRAIIAQRMLKRHKIFSTIYLGVNKDKKNNMQAHAWLRCGEVFVTGGYEKNDFKEVARFSNVK